MSKLLSIFFVLFFMIRCGNDEEPVDPIEEIIPKVIADPSMTYQEMVGFGGALTWYCDRITQSSKKDEIIDLITNDLEVEMIRLKNWYYPTNYPVNKTSDAMEIGFFKQHFDATNELFDLLKQKNPNIKILFSSWGPPSGLKSNGSTRSGTLKMVNDSFMYDEFATYWEDILDHITFNPDYLSIQNEPSYVNDGWETCEWRPTETADLPGYDIAFDKVYDKVKNRVNPPVFVGPESANIGTSSFGNTFATFADAIKGKPQLGAYAYHPYNFNESNDNSSIATALSLIKKSYNDKPNFMTEYSGMSWFKTGQLINSVLKNANASGYIYWEMMWEENSEFAMIQVDASGDFVLTPFYYLMKHYSKFIHNGYKRIEMRIENSKADVVGFVNPSGDKIVLILLNSTSSSIEVNLEVQAENIKTISGVQSVENDTYKELSGLSADQPIKLTSKSVTTIILGI